MTNTVYVINHILESILLYYYAFSFYPHKRNRLTEIFLFTTSYAVMFFFFLHQSIYLNVLIQFFIFMFLFLYLTNASILEAVKSTLLNLLLITVSELAFDIPSVLFRPDTKFEYPSLRYLLTALIVMRTIHFFLESILIHIRKKWSLIPLSPLHKVFSVIFLAITFIALFAVQALGFITELSNHQIPWVFSILIAIIALCMGGIFFSLLFQKSQYELINSRNAIQRQKDERTYNEIMSDLNQKQRIILHDFRRHIQTIDDLVKTKAFNELESYVDALQNDPAISEKYTHVRNQTLGVLLARYKTTCEEKHIVLTVDITPDSFVSLTPVETSALLGNLMDNAVNAATKCSNPYIHLRIQHNSQLNQDVLTLVNSCLEAPKQNLRGEFLSNKKDSSSHGVGMRSIKRVVQNNNGMIHSYFSNEDTSFHTTLMIQTTEKSL